MNFNSIKKEIASEEGREYIDRFPHKIAVFMVFFISIGLLVGTILLMTIKKTGTTVISAKIINQSIKPSVEFELPTHVFPDLKIGSDLKIGFCEQNKLLHKNIISTELSKDQSSIIIQVPVDKNDLTEACSFNLQLYVIEPERSLLNWLFNLIFPKTH